jgi:Restriction endonuclease NotI
MLISEIFGRGVLDVSPDATEIRKTKMCPFRGTTCTKSSKTDPIGICSLSDGKEAAAICPVRFLEGDRIFRDAAKIAFGSGYEVGIFPEIRILRILNEDTKDAKKIGKVDFLIGKIENGKIVDFAAIEVQSSYFSGTKIGPALKYFLQHNKLDEAISDRRPDFRSSAQKRLMPQLQLKVPVFRRWGKKFFVVVDTKFFQSLPIFKTSSASNSEVIWLNYPIALNGNSYTLKDPIVVGSHWDDVITSLREGVAPETHEIFEELQSKLLIKGKTRPRTMIV